MSTALWTGLILLALGVAVWLFGNRMWLLGAGAGALLGYGLLRLFPSITDGTLGLLIVIGMMVLFGVLGFIGKAFAKIIAWVIGFVIGGGLALAFLSLLSATPGLLDWILALITGAVVALIFGRFLNWGLIIFAALLGSMLMIRGVTMAFPRTARRNARHADRPGPDGGRHLLSLPPEQSQTQRTGCHAAQELMFRAARAARQAAAALRG